MKKGKVEERGCCPDRFSASIDRQWVEKTDKSWPWWMEGGGDMGRIGLGGWWMDGGWGKYVENWREKRSTAA